ncbi:hypothetical protein NUW54_g4317 [Trametes sanguinea]|uniref:Uncharacterized protein n=2 Tax=Trametes sanguinea TaxID=158606 RepID=A0ACC1PSA2_9APHY|nr:hypothetical protein NUW54_g6427 [Trametes sanguinea]KAJ3005491.1 hypothetical protein NUW54_g4317 [Trametes sanguinea]
MDKKGIQRGGGKRLQHIKYFVPRGRRVNYKLRSSNLELITIIECISADGTALSPGFIFAGSQVPADMYKDIDPQVVVGHSPNGWTEGFLCVEWFRRCFLPQATARRETDALLLLILDGHNSHITPELRQLAIENNVHLFLLQPHTTHRLQPLNIGIFSHIQNAWIKRCNQYYSRSLGREMSCGQLTCEYLALHQHVLKSSLIRKAWQQSGITSGTWSADFFSEEDFALSYTTSAVAHVPSTYPKIDAIVALTEAQSETPGHLSDTAYLPSRSPTPTPSRLQRSLSRHEKVLRLQEENARLRKKNQLLLGRAENALAHASIAKWELERIQEEMNRKTSSNKKRRKVHTTAALITAGEGAAQCEREEIKAIEKEAQRQAEQARRAEEDRNCQIHRERITCDCGVTFSGTLSRKVKDDLKDIAFSLGLSLDGTNSELVTQITGHLRAHAAQYSTHPKFSALYSAGNGLLCSQKCPLPPELDNENSPPPASRCRARTGWS